MLKKYRGFIFGLVIGLVIATTGTVFAAELSQVIGKKVDAVYPVYVDGSRLDQDAISIEGTSYLPVRKFAETVSYAVYWDDQDKTISLDNTEDVKPVEEQSQPQKASESNEFVSPQVFIPDPIEANQKLIELYQMEINRIQSNIDHITNVAEQGERDAIYVGGTTEQYKASQRYQDYLSQLSNLQAELAQAQAELDALQ